MDFHSISIKIIFDKIIEEFHAMTDSMEKEYFKRAINCIINWDQAECSNANIIHIHGTADRLLQYKNIKADYSIKNGSHAMVVNKAEEISKILNKIL